MANNAVINFLFNSEGAFKALNDFKSKLGQTVDAISKNTLTKFGALGSAIGSVASIKNFYDETVKLSQLSETFRLPIDQVSKFANTLALFGGDSDQAVSDLQSLEQAITDLWTTASGPLKNVGSQIGLTLSRSDTSLDVIDKIRAKFKGLKDEAQIKVAQELGLASPASLRLLRASNEEYAEMRKRASAMGVINPEQQKKVLLLQRSIATLRQSFVALGGSLIGIAAPAIDKITQAMEWLSKQSDTVRLLVLGLPIAFGALGVVLPIIKLITGGFLTLTGVITKLFALMIANPVGAVIAAIAAGAFLIIANWEQVKSYLSTVWQWIEEKAEWLGNVFAKIFNGFVDWIKGIFEKIPFIGKALKDEINSVDSDVELKAGLRMGMNPMPVNQTMFPRSENIINNNQSQSRINQTYNVTFNGVQNPGEIENRFSNFVHQNAGGVVR